MELTQALDRLAVPSEQGAKTDPKPHNAHIHLPPNFSAFQSVQEAIVQAKTEGCVLLGAANYYDYVVFGPFIDQALSVGIYPVLGTEILTWMQDCADAGWLVNDPGNPGKAYLCGKAMARCDRPTPWAAALLAKIRDGDTERMNQMADALEQICDQAGHPTGLTGARCVELLAQRFAVLPETVVLQERHLAMLFQEALAEIGGSSLTDLLGPESAKGSAVQIQGEIRSRFMKAGKPAYVPENFVSFDDAVRMVQELGGIPCYPAIMDGIPGITDFEKTPDILVERLLGHGIPAVEFIPTRNDPQVLADYATAAHKAGLVVTVGTEHNTLGKQPMVPTCKGGVPIPSSLRHLFWEGACVLAGHQTAVRNGQPGFMDVSTKAEESIDHFRSLGENALRTVEQSHGK